MAITINGSGTITGISAGGLPDGSVTAADLASSLDLTGKTVTLPSGTGGKILQIVSTSKVDSFSTNSDSFVDVTGLSASITPSATSSKIYIVVNMMVGAHWWSYRPKINLVRGSTNICQSTGGTNENATAMVVNYSDGAPNSSDMCISQSITFLDSPSTTSSTTYKIQATRLVVNRRASDTFFGGTSNITLMEVAG